MLHTTDVSSTGDRPPVFGQGIYDLCIRVLLSAFTKFDTLPQAICQKKMNFIQPESQASLLQILAVSN